MPFRPILSLFFIILSVFCFSAKAQDNDESNKSIAFEISIPKINYKENIDTTAVLYNKTSSLDKNIPDQVYIGDERLQTNILTHYYDPYISPKKLQELLFEETKKELEKLGYIDTSKKILNTKVKTFDLDISVENFNYYLVKKGLPFMPGYQIDMTYIIKDSYHQKQLELPIHITTNHAKCNVFSIKQFSNLDHIAADTLKNHIRRNLHEILTSKEFSKAMYSAEKDAKEQTNNETASFITLNAQNYESINASEAIKAVVTIITKSGHGSGCIISQDGYIVTNYHVIAGETKFTVTNDELKTDSVQVVRTDKVNDLALLKVPLNNLKHLILTEETIETGTEVYTIGTPADIALGQTISRGIISATRIIDEKKTIQSDARISPGNSGGAMINKKGKILGIVNAKLVGTGIEGIGFAIPAETVLKSFRLKY